MSSFQLEVNEIRHPQVVYYLEVRWHSTIKQIKEKIHCITNYPTTRIQIFHPAHSAALADGVTLGDLGMGQAYDLMERPNVLMMALQYASTEHVIQPLNNLIIDRDCRELVQHVRSGLTSAKGLSKTDVLDCTGGVYFLRSSNGNIAGVFKPRDEEQGMPNNPKGHHGDGKVGLRENFKPGKGFVREFAAYVMDERHFTGVPPTALVHCEHPSFHYPLRPFPKLGSLQKYVRASDTFEDISPSLISTFEMQKIALFDMRVLNHDRNSANILALRKPYQSRAQRGSRSGSTTSWTEESGDEFDMGALLEEEPMCRSRDQEQDLYELIPIDHGYCLPTSLLIEDFDWVWFDCKQIAQPVHEDIRKYVKTLDVEHLIDKLTSQVTIPEDALFLLRVVHHLIVRGIDKGLNLKNIADLIVRTPSVAPSPLEKVLQNSKENAFRTVEARNPFAGSFSFSNTPLLGSCPLLTGTTASPASVVHKSFANDPFFRSRSVLNVEPSNEDFRTMKSLDSGFSQSASDFQNASLMATYSQSTMPFIRERSSHEPVMDNFSTVVVTSEPLNFDKNGSNRRRERAFSCYTTDDETESNCDSLAFSPGEPSFMDAIPMQRVASFTAFESPIIYNLNEKSDRQFMRLKTERRRRMTKTAEFKQLRLSFALTDVDQMIHKISSNINLCI